MSVEKMAEILGKNGSQAPVLGKVYAQIAEGLGDCSSICMVLAKHSDAEATAASVMMAVAYGPADALSRYKAFLDLTFNDVAGFHGARYLCGLVLGVFESLEWLQGQGFEGLGELLDELPELLAELITNRTMYLDQQQISNWPQFGAYKGRLSNSVKAYVKICYQQDRLVSLHELCRRVAQIRQANVESGGGADSGEFGDIMLSDICFALFGRLNASQQLRLVTPSLSGMLP